MNTPWSSRPNRESTVGDRPGRARYRAGAMSSLRSAPRGTGEPEVVPRLIALCPLSLTDGKLRTGGVFLQRQESDLRQRRLGTLYVFIAAVLYSIGGLCIKIIPWNGMSINSARNIVALMVVGGYLLLKSLK